jgi:tRNA modification GTPase
VYNRILGYDAAIVTDVEGTTRDVLRETATLGSTVLRLSDTAGLRKTDDLVESIGMERTWEEIGRAGLILAVFDASCPPTEADRDLAERIVSMETPAIALWNKADLEQSEEIEDLQGLFSHSLSVCAASGEGFDALGRLIDELFIDGELNMAEDAVVTGARQFAALSSAEEALSAALSDLENGIPLDLCCVEIEDALLSLGEVDGRELGEEIVAEIFSKFCVGK